MKTTPFIKLFIPLSAGILSSIYGNWIDVRAEYILIELLLILVLLYLNNKKYYRPLTFIISLLYFLTGAMLLELCRARNSSFCIKNMYQEGDYYIGIIQEVPLLKTNSVQCIVQTTHILRSDSFIPCIGSIQLSISNKIYDANTFQCGHQIITKCRLSPLENPKNPFSFNYKEYLHQKNIFLSGFIKNTHDFIVLPQRNYHSAKNIRPYIIGILQKYGFQQAELGIMGALMIGDKTFLSKETIASYSQTGTIHVLAVSGMHVAILFLLDKFLSWFDPKKRQRVLKNIVLLLFLWSYAFLTGFSASVLRATLMFSLPVIGQLWNKKSNIQNTLSSSAFVLVCIDPFMILDVGFLLSYLAVLGIIYIHPIILPYISWYITKPSLQWLNVPLEGFWSMLSISLAAQCTTFPLTVYLFHQFPNYFLLSNMLIIPISTLILYGGIIFFISHFVLGFSFTKPLAFLLQKSIVFLNQLNEYLGNLPYALSKNIYISEINTYVLYALLLSILGFIHLKKHLFIQIILCLCICFYSVHWYEIHHMQSKDYLIVFHQPKQHFIGYYSQNQSFHYASKKNNFVKSTLPLEFSIHYQAKEAFNSSGESDFFTEGFWIKNPKKLFCISPHARNSMKYLEGFPTEYVWICDTINPYHYFRNRKKSIHRFDYQLYEQVILKEYTARSFDKIKLPDRSMYIVDEGLESNYKYRWLYFLKQNGYVVHETKKDGFIDLEKNNRIFERMRIIGLAFFLVHTVLVYSQTETYGIYFSNKKGVSFNPYEYFDPKAIQRRIKLGISLYDSSDFDLCPQYYTSIEENVDSMIGKSRWMNLVFVKAHKEQIQKIQSFPFVRLVERFENTIKSISQTYEQSFSLDTHLLLEQTEHLESSVFEQENLTGKGIRIAVFDVGFPGVDQHIAFNHLRERNGIISTFDFTKNKSNVYRAGNHGTTVLSCITGKYSSRKLGLATDAEFLLAITEYGKREPFSEERYWLQAAEWADKNGADIINSSLGYTKQRYFKDEMDGAHSLVAKAARMATRKGILVVNAAGNDGSDPWHIIGTPADVDSVLSVGGINPYTNYVISFSSRGPNQKKQYKPNVCAFGHVIAANQTNYEETFGTSFSAPLIAGFAACAWQSDTSMTNMDLFKKIEESSTLYPYFDYAHGFGIPQASAFLKKMPNKSIDYKSTEIQGLVKNNILYISITDSSFNSSEFTSTKDAILQFKNKFLYYHIRDAYGVLKKYVVMELFSNKTIEIPVELFEKGDQLHLLYNKKSYVHSF